MKKIILTLCLFTGIALAQPGLSLGFGPYHGMVSAEYTMLDEHLSANFHIPWYDSDYDFVGGIGVAYRFKGLTGPYVFHTSEWVNGTFKGFKVTFVNDVPTNYEEIIKDINYWRLVFGLGYQHMFATHFGAYFEMGFEFYAGNGSYFTHCDFEWGTLDNEQLVFPAGLGILVEF